MNLRPLGIAEEIIQATALNITYTYDDLVFVEHNVFIIQFDDDNPKNLKLFFNVDCEEETAKKLENQLTASAKEKLFSITCSGKFEMAQKEGAEEVDIKFFPKTVS